MDLIMGIIVYGGIILFLFVLVPAFFTSLREDRENRKFYENMTGGSYTANVSRATDYNSEINNNENRTLFDSISHAYISRGIDHSEARESAITLLNKSELYCKQNNLLIYDNIGDKIFDLAKTDRYLGKCLEKARKDRASEDDIIVWWNLSSIEREVIKAFNEMDKLALFIDYLNKGYSEDDAATEIKKQCAIFGYPDNDSNPDRHLPPELKRVSDMYRADVNRNQDKYEELLKQLERESSYNAYFRREILPKMR